MSNEVVTINRLNLWRGIAIGAFVIGGACEWVRGRILSHDDTIARLTVLQEAAETRMREIEKRQDRSDLFLLKPGN